MHQMVLLVQVVVVLRAGLQAPRAGAGGLDLGSGRDEVSRRVNWAALEAPWLHRG
jgi:hypothetical protein